MNSNDMPIALLGVMADKSNIEEIVRKIEDVIANYPKDLRPQYIATMNVDFLVQANSTFSAQPLNLELIHILREARLATVDGMPLVWLSSLLGSSLKERVTGVDLIPPLVKALSEKKQSLFLLGGEEKTLKMCILYLQSTNPGIRITGALHPKIYTEGEIQESNNERDNLLVEQINKASPDILFINLGNPKQEIWFERIKHKLHIPVSIGVGGSFDLLSGNIPRAPTWMQKWGLEWLFRLYQEPKRLIVRYLKDIIRFPLMSIPLVLYHNFNRLIAHLFSKDKNRIYLRNSHLFISKDQTITVIPLPHILNERVAVELKKNWDDFFSQDALLIDFNEVLHIDLEGLGFLLLVWRRARREKKQVLALNISTSIYLLLCFHRVWDYLSPYVCKSPKEALLRVTHQGKTTHFFDSIQQNHNKVVISFFGRLDNQMDFDAYQKKIHSTVYQKECILDMTYCTYIDNSGISFLMKLKNNNPHVFNNISLYNIPAPIERQLRYAKVFHLFQILPNLNDFYE